MRRTHALLALLVACMACGRVSFDRMPDSGAAADAVDVCVGIDVQSDPKHCGVCGHDCLGGDCIAGACQSVVIATFPTRAQQIAVDATNMYWTNEDNSVMQCALSGCGNSPLVLATGQFQAEDIAVDATTVYWTNYNDSNPSTVMKCAIDGCAGAPTPLATGQIGPLSIVADNTNVYWTNFNGQTVEQCARTGCVTPTRLASNMVNAWGITVNATTVYWVQNTGVGGIRTCAIGGCGDAPGLLVTNQINPSEVVVDASHAYWTESGNRRVWRCLLADCMATQTMLADNQETPRLLVIDSTNVYWIDGGDRLRACALDGCAMTPTTVATETNIGGIAVDAVALYWAGQGVARKLAK